jgi:hypothetical protein
MVLEILSSSELVEAGRLNVPLTYLLILLHPFSPSGVRKAKMVIISLRHGDTEWWYEGKVRNRQVVMAPSLVTCNMTHGKSISVSSIADAFDEYWAPSNALEMLK